MSLGKFIDFSITGGFPFNQATLDYLQSAWSDALVGLASADGDGSTPIVLSGMAVTSSGSTRHVAAGYFLYNGTIYEFVASSYTVPILGSDVYVVIADSTSNLTYRDGAVHAAKHMYQGTVVVLPVTTLVDDTHFYFSSMLKLTDTTLARLNSVRAAQATWTSHTISTGAGDGTITGTIRHKVDVIGNIMLLEFTLVVATPADFTANPNPTLIGLLTGLPHTATNYNIFYTAIGGAGILDSNAQTINSIMTIATSSGTLVMYIPKSVGPYNLYGTYMVPLG